MNKIPVIILNWNGFDDTVKSVESVRNQTHTAHHIFLVDNNSANGEGDRLQERYSDNEAITVICNDKNLGFARAHNQVFEHILQNTNFTHIALLNNDAFAEPNWLAAMDACAKQYNAGMVSCKMLFHESPDKINNLGHKFLNTGEILPIAWNAPANTHTNVRSNAGASGGACLYSVEMLKDIGLFDEYFITGYEDAELGLRAMIAGYPLMYEPDSIVSHKVGASINKVRDYKYTLKLQLDIIYAYFKLMPIAVIILNMPWVVFRTTILFILFAFWGRWVYFKIFFHGWFLILTRDKQVLKSARKNTARIRRLPWHRILRNQEFFLIDNIKRFYTYFVQGQKTVFEKFE